MRLTRGNATVAGTGLVALVVAVVVAAVSINLSFGLPLGLHMGWPPSRDYTLRAAFQDANGLNKGADVVVAGDVIGQVTDVRVQGRRALVTMRIGHAHAPVHRGAVARIRYSTLLAQKYVELTPAAGTPAIPDGGSIPSDQTVTPVDFDQFLSSLDPQTRRQVQVLVQQLGGGVQGRHEAINQLLDQLSGLSVESRAGLATLHARDPQLATIISGLAVASGRLALTKAQLADLVGKSALVMGVLVESDRDLDSLLVHLANVMNDFDQTLAGNEDNLRQIVRTLDPFLVQLNSTLTTTYPYLLGSHQSFRDQFQYLIPYIGSAIAQHDGNGNYLRQYVVVNPCFDLPNSPLCVGGPAQASGAQPAAPATAAPAAPSPKSAPSPCPLATPSPLPLPTPPPLPLPTPSLTPCPTVSPCAPPVPKPAPTPSPTPTCSPAPAGSAPALPVPLPSPLALLLGGG